MDSTRRGFLKGSAALVGAMAIPWTPAPPPKATEKVATYGTVNWYVHNRPDKRYMIQVLMAANVIDKDGKLRAWQMANLFPGESFAEAEDALRGAMARTFLMAAKREGFRKFWATPGKGQIVSV